MPSETIKIANLPKVNEPCPKGRFLVVSGWGSDATRPFRPNDNLWAVSQKCMNDSSCPRLNDMNPKTNLLCVGDLQNKLNSACYGDSGGIF